MKIVVVSGKGGTGKTTIAASVVASAAIEGIKIAVADCDVEEPNLHIFLRPVIKKKITVNKHVPLVDESLCTYCGKCAEVCEYNAIAVPGHKVLVFEDLCHSCGACSTLCPKKAIVEVKRAVGEISVGHVNIETNASGTLAVDYVSGKLNVGKPIASMVVRAVKNYVHENIANDVIIDAPPGAGCPVIESLMYADHALLVAEPTPFGLYDLKVIVEAVNSLSIDASVIINKYSKDYDKVERYCRNEGLEVVMRIPYSREIATSYAKGELFVLRSATWRKQFVDLYRALRQ